MRLLFNLFLTVLMSTLQSGAIAQNFPNQKYEVWTAKDFRFHTGEIAPTLNMATPLLAIQRVKSSSFCMAQLERAQECSIAHLEPSYLGQDKF